jgi:palmitoyltransferase
MLKGYCLINVIVVIFYLGATFSDPTDEQVQRERNDIMNSVFKNYDPDLYPYECNFCSTHVSKTSKHCRSCNRCVEDFDHHCEYLNNCIGAKNYNDFFCLVVSLNISCWIHVVVSSLSVYQGNRKLS